MRDGWFAFWVLTALIVGFVLGISFVVNGALRSERFADCVLEQRGTVQECAVKSGRWEQ